MVPLVVTFANQSTGSETFYRYQVGIHWQSLANRERLVKTYKRHAPKVANGAFRGDICYSKYQIGNAL